MFGIIIDGWIDSDRLLVGGRLGGEGSMVEGKQGCHLEACDSTMKLGG